ncbi:pseudouridine synthase [Pseudomonas sp. RIT-PI-AD]|uniref:pseudouridine synthase n=1 Tax=Pseudomonas sp. RIT-PI-AD TaxID=3035294 RepID=UPI0021DADD05|nr:pseudouridine synthase [Pseudomonas sp. RIT-PI-AD]
MRLDRLLGHRGALSRRDVRLALASGRVSVDGMVQVDGLLAVSPFQRVDLDGKPLQAGKPARYFMLHKPAGWVSATCHPEHPTVLDLLDEPDKDELHLAGRLDLNTTGLLLITNDGLWSRRATLPGSRLPKVYRVHTEQPIQPRYAEAFAQGIHFAYEGLTTLPATLEILAPREARLSLHEGRYHQVKRMFGHFQNKVLDLHRERIGPIVLDLQLPPGAYRSLTQAEIDAF